MEKRKNQEKQKKVYLAIAITTLCNKKCFYCKRGGESLSQEEETIPLHKLEKVIRNAYEVGIKNFRLTGGEPTCVDYFDELIEFIMALRDTKIRINTNGNKILEHLHTLEKYKDRIDIILSVDSIYEYINEVHFPKFLSEDVVKMTVELKKREIHVRFNVVITKLNKSQVKELVLKSIDELQVDIKLLDLKKEEEYLGFSNKAVDKEAIAFWHNLYVPMQEFYDWLEEISIEHEDNWTTGFIGKGMGIPMSVYFVKNNSIQVKDSQLESYHSVFCRKKCPYFKEKNCREGMFSIFLSTNLVLNWSGCKNGSLQIDLNEYDDNQIKEAFKYLLKCM